MALETARAHSGCTLYGHPRRLAGGGQGLGRGALAHCCDSCQRVHPPSFLDRAAEANKAAFAQCEEKKERTYGRIMKIPSKSRTVVRAPHWSESKNIVLLLLLYLGMNRVERGASRYTSDRLAKETCWSSPISTESDPSL